MLLSELHQTPNQVSGWFLRFTITYQMRRARGINVDGSFEFLKNCWFRFFKYFRIEELSVPVLWGNFFLSETKNHRFCLFRKTNR